MPSTVEEQTVPAMTMYPVKKEKPDPIGQERAGEKEESTAV
ncbi:hypothetical protein [Paenibacillus uliginis]|nr:hypothetical protein [Paenibacillus uliginis]